MRRPLGRDLTVVYLGQPIAFSPLGSFEAEHHPASFERFTTYDLFSADGQYLLQVQLYDALGTAVCPRAFTLPTTFDNVSLVLLEASTRNRLASSDTLEASGTFTLEGFLREPQFAISFSCTGCTLTVQRDGGVETCTVDGAVHDRL